MSASTLYRALRTGASVKAFEIAGRYASRELVAKAKCPPGRFCASLRAARKWWPGQLLSWPILRASLRAAREMVAAGGNLPLADFARIASRRAKWIGRAELNHRHKDFQSSALPTELLGLGTAVIVLAQELLGQACNYSKLGQLPLLSQHLTRNDSPPKRPPTRPASPPAPPRRGSALTATPCRARRARRFSSRRSDRTAGGPRPSLPTAQGAGTPLADAHPPHRARDRSSPPRDSLRRSRGSSPDRGSIARIRRARAGRRSSRPDDQPPSFRCR